MTVYAVYQTSNGVLVSVGTIVANPLPAGLAALALAAGDAQGLRDGTKTWDPATLTCIARPIEVADSPGVGVAVMRNSGQQNNTSNSTLVAITGMEAAVTAGRRYILRALVPFRTVATTTGIGFGFTGPAMSTFSASASIQQGAAGTDQTYVNTSTALASVLTSTAVAVANTTYLAVVDAVFTPSASGTIALTFRSEVNASQASVMDGAGGSLIDCG